ncbi:unnamed protein product [Adineta ricciae]|uniref:Uncharacterized protein n=1 Tax=Adineta ricciae TaxID=249248 RepID=A0A815Z5L4_ADIRI|nr:unnamed protein product [Adineta ricciae]CAF1578090.1 unnamed protein product [Adineta ricciae]
MILISFTIHDLLCGINTHSIDERFNDTSQTIPLIIHQMWKTNDLSSYPINNSQHVWKRFFPTYVINLWTDEQIEKLILKAEYEFLYPVYKSYLYSIQRADLARLIILHSHGGIYADLDVYPHGTNLEELLRQNVSFIIGRSSSDTCLVNHFMISQQNSSILSHILENIHKKSFFNQIYVLPYLEVFATGSIYLTNILRNYRDQRLLILSKDELSQYIYHDAGRSWHLFDGYIINRIDAHPKQFLVVILICFLICCVRWRKSCRIFHTKR